MSEPRFIVKALGSYHYPTVWDTKADTFAVQIAGGTSLFAQAEAERLAELLNTDIKSGLAEIQRLGTQFVTELQ